MTYGKASIVAKAEYHLESYQIGLAIADCRYCKTAKTKVQKQMDAVLDGAPEGDVMTEQAEKFWGDKVARAACKKHKTARGLAYVTSPVSETYWAS